MHSAVAMVESTTSERFSLKLTTSVRARRVDAVPTTRFANVRGHGCRIDEWGPARGEAARTIVLLHGLLGTNEHWTPVAAELGREHRVVCIETPVLELGRDECSIEGVVSIVQDLVRMAGVERAIIGGSSLGGHIAARLALADPGVFEGLMLMGSSGLQERATSSEVVTTPSRQWLADRFGVMFHDRARCLREDDLERAFDLLSDRRRVRAFVRLCRSSRADGIAERLALLSMPTLLVWGRNDVVTPPEAAEGFARAIPHARLRWIDRCGHAPMVEQPAELARLIADFAESLAEE